MTFSFEQVLADAAACRQRVNARAIRLDQEWHADYNQASSETQAFYKQIIHAIEEVFSKRKLTLTTVVLDRLKRSGEFLPYPDSDEAGSTIYWDREVMFIATRSEHDRTLVTQALEQYIVVSHQHAVGAMKSLYLLCSQLHNYTGQCFSQVPGFPLVLRRRTISSTAGDIVSTIELTPLSRPTLGGREPDISANSVDEMIVKLAEHLAHCKFE